MIIYLIDLISLIRRFPNLSYIDLPFRCKIKAVSVSILANIILYSKILILNFLFSPYHNTYEYIS